MTRTILERGIKVRHKYFLCRKQSNILLKRTGLTPREKIYSDSTNPLGLANRCLLGDGIIVPVEEADEAEDESSSSTDSGKDLNSSALSSSSR